MGHIIQLLVVFCWVSLSQAATYWVNPIGTSESPYATKATGVVTIAEGVALLDAGSAGDVLYIANGTYAEGINASVSGSSSAYKTIQAETDGGVIISLNHDYNSGNMAGAAGHWTALSVTGDYVKVQGFLFKGGYQNSGEILSSSDHAYIKNCGFLDAYGPETYAQVFLAEGTYFLVEDCWFAGGGRYSTATLNGSYGVFRRCVSRYDYSTGTQPIGGFMNYHAGYTGHDISYQNCIAIDFNDPIGHDTWLTGGFVDKYGVSVDRDGCIAMSILSSDQTGSGASVDVVGQRMAAYFVEPGPNGAPVDHVTKNSISINSYKGFYPIRPGNMTFENVSAFGSTTLGYAYGQGTVTITSSLFANNAGNSTTGSVSYSHFLNDTPFGTNSTSGTTGMVYPVRIEEGSAIYETGVGGLVNRGAEIMFKIGAEGSHYGDLGWEDLTDNELWPWPNETRIRADFKDVESQPSGTIPLNSNPDRGFCATGETLTNYILGSLGAPEVTDWDAFYLGTAPVVPAVNGACGTASGQSFSSLTESSSNLVVSGTTVYGFLETEGVGWTWGSLGTDNDGSATDTAIDACSATYDAGVIPSGNKVLNGYIFSGQPVYWAQ